MEQERKRKVSTVWDRFDLISTNKVRCRICSTELSYMNKSTSTMVRHFRAKHENEVTNAPIRNTASRKHELDQAVLNFIFKDHQPLSIVESEGFRELLQVLEPSYVLPTRKTVEEMVTKKYEEEQERGKMEVPQAVAVSVLMSASAESTTDNEDQVEVQQLENPPSGSVDPPRQNNMSDEEPDSTEGQQSSQQREVEEPLSLLAGVALAPPSGAHVPCRCQDVRPRLQSIQRHFLFLKSKADRLKDCLVHGEGDVDKDHRVPAVRSFLLFCQPYFNYLESTARSTVSQHTQPPADICLARRMLTFSQQLCKRLEKLVLTFASYNLLCLDETEPDGVSHFCIGRFKLGRLKLTIFRYCKLTPYLAQRNTGLFKRMRWNVKRLRDKQQKDKKQSGGSDEDQKETAIKTDYYFLCYEDIPNPHADNDNPGVSNSSTVRMWSIGQWVQVYPNPDKENIDDWILCDVPQAEYRRLLPLGSDEPSSRRATDHLQQLLSSQLTD